MDARAALRGRARVIDVAAEQDPAEYSLRALSRCREVSTRQGSSHVEEICTVLRTRNTWGVRGGMQGLG